MTPPSEDCTFKWAKYLANKGNLKSDTEKHKKTEQGHSKYTVLIWHLQYEFLLIVYIYIYNQLYVLYVKYFTVQAFKHRYNLILLKFVDILTQYYHSTGILFVILLDTTY